MRPLAPVQETVSSSSLALGSGLRDWLDTLVRRRRLVLGFTAAGLAVALTGLMVIPPRYTAETLVMVENRTRNPVPVEAVVANLPGDSEAVSSEIEILRSRELAARVIAQLDLANNTGFAPRDSGVAEASSGNVPGKLIDRFLDDLKVEKAGGSRVISIRFTTAEPALAARVANTLADQYIAQQLESKLSATRHASSWLDQQVAALREKVRVADEAVEQFRSKSGLVEGQGGLVATQQVSELNSQLMLAKVAQAEAEARVEQARALHRSPNGIASANDVLKSELIQRLSASEAELERKRAELLSELGKRHPRLEPVDAEIADMRRRIGIEVGKIVQGLENEARIARGRTAILKQNLDALEARTGEAGNAQVKLRALQAEADASRELLRTFMARAKETGSQTDGAVQQPDALIVSRADAPLKPSFPQPLPFIGLLLVGSGLLGAMSAFVADQLERGFHSSEQLEKDSDIASLGFVPLLTERARKLRPRRYYPMTNPIAWLVQRHESAFAAALRTLRWNLDLAHGAPPRSLLVTSTQPDEGKTTLAACLACTYALGGKSVIVVDADCLRPGAHRALGLPPGPGLAEFLAGETALDATIAFDNGTGVAVLRAGEPRPDAVNLLARPAFATLVNKLKERYDLVIVDAPPNMAGAEARVLAANVEMTLFVVRFRTTPRAHAIHALHELQTAGAQFAGTVLNMVDLRRGSPYGYRDAAYYGTLKSYYKR